MKRYDIINHLIKKHGFTSYLEIGCFQGENFNRIECEVKESVDPEFPATYQMTSDEFFTKYVHREYGLVFVDGMHTARQAYKDIFNSMDYCKIILELDGFYREKTENILQLRKNLLSLMV